VSKIAVHSGNLSRFDSILSFCARDIPIDEALLRTRLGETTAWDNLLAAANFHSLTPLLAAAIVNLCPDAVPVSVLRALNDVRRDAVAFNLNLSSELRRLLALFNTEGIAALPIKGPILAEFLYSDPSLRPSSDLDILVHTRDVLNVLRILKSQGYETEPYLARLPAETLVTLKSEVLLHHSRGNLLDLHWEIAPRDYPFWFDSEVMWRSICPARLNGKDVSSVAPETLLVFLSVHGTKHLWSRLIWLADIARLARTNLNWEEAFALGKRIGCERPVLLGLLLAHEMLDAVIPEEYLERARSEQIVVSSAEQAKVYLRSDTPSDPTSLEVTIFNVKLADHWWKKVRHFAALLKAPTEAELRCLSLPPKLFFLYYPVRLFRLVAKYVSHSSRSR
jgi:hypothetical protein